MQEQKKNQDPVCARRAELVSLVTTPILTQLNQNFAAMRERIVELQETLDMIARQIATQISE